MRYWTALAALMLTAPIHAQDGDDDGIPDAAERLLATDPSFAESLELVYTDGSAADGDASITRDNYSAERDLVSVYFGSIAGNRCLWAFEFAAPCRLRNSVVILYLDADNDPTTGRKNGMVGTDFMLTVYDGGAGTRTYGADGQQGTGAPPRFAVSGRRLYFCKDLDLNVEGGRSTYRAAILSETVEPRKGVDSTGWFRVSGPGPLKRKKIMTIEDAAASQNVGATFGLDIIRKAKRDPANIVLSIEDCDLQGFELDQFTEYRSLSVRRKTAPATITATAPKAGVYHVGFIFYDTEADERWGIYVGGELKGIVVASDDNNREHLYFLTEAIEFRGGEKITLRAANTASAYRTEDLILLAKPPAARKRTFEFQALKAARAGSDAARVTWISTWPCAAKVRVTAKGVDAIEVGETEQLNNHRVVVHGLRTGLAYTVRLEATAPDGKSVNAETKLALEDRPVAVTRAATVPLRVAGAEGVAYQDWPVTFGIPLPQDGAATEDEFRLADAAGNEVPLQVSVTGRWPDGSIKWALLDFLADVPGPGPASYTLHYGADVSRSAPDARVQVTESDEGVVVNTGPLSFEVMRSGPGPLGKVTLLGREISDGAAAYLTDADGKTHATLGPPERIVVEEAGPLRAVVRVEGHHVAEDGSKLFAYAARIHAYAEKSYLRVFYTFGNDRAEQQFTDIRSLVLRAPLSLTNGTRVAAGGGGENAAEPQPPPLRVSRFGGADVKRPLPAEGWLDLSDGQRGAMVAVRNFAQLYPKELLAADNGLEVGICPALAEDQYAPKDKVEEVRLFYYLLGGRYKLRQGVTKRHELLLYFHEGDAHAARVAEVADSFGEPLVIATPPRYCADTKALGDIAAADGRFPDYATGYEKALQAYLADRDQNSEYGMLNFGDWWGERKYNWGNIEYDTQHSFFMQFARSADRRAFLCGEQAERHNMDVDTVHYGDNGRIGGVYAHCIGHTGNYYDERPVDGGTPGGHFTVSHTWTEGHVAYYHLTGDRRALETARTIADHFDSYGTRNYDFTNCRVPGWHLTLTLALYDATGDEYYLNAARIIVERVLERQNPPEGTFEGDPPGGWGRQMMPGHCHCMPRHRGNAAFMVGVLLWGMKHYHEITGDERVARSIIAGARYVVDDMWTPEVRGFRYTSCPKTGPSTGANMIVMEGILYAQRLSGDERLAEVGCEGVESAIEHFSGFGKSISMQTCTSPRVLFDYARIKGLKATAR